MPDRAPSFCVVPGCSVLTPRRRCPSHQVDQEHSRRNFDVRRWYRSKRWKGLRVQILQAQASTCARCRRITPRLEIDHVIKHQGNPDVFWDRFNLQALCRTCHQKKTRKGE